MGRRSDRFRLRPAHQPLGIALDRGPRPMPFCPTHPVQGQLASLMDGSSRRLIDGFVALFSERGAQPSVDSGPRRFATAASIRRERVSGFFALSMARTCSRLRL